MINICSWITSYPYQIFGGVLSIVAFLFISQQIIEKLYKCQFKTSENHDHLIIIQHGFLGIFISHSLKLKSCINSNSKTSKPLVPKIALVLFAYLYIYKSKFSKTYRGNHIKLLSETANRFEVLNTCKANPNDYNFRGQLIRMELPLITYHNSLTFEVYFEKIPREKRKQKDKQITNENDDETFIKGTIIGNNSDNKTVRIQITNFAKLISMNMETNDNTKSIIIEVNKFEMLSKKDILNDVDDGKSDFDTHKSNDANNTDSDYDSSDPFVFKDDKFKLILFTNVSAIICTSFV